MPADEFRAYMGRHAKPREDDPAMLKDTSLLRLAVIILGAALLICLAGVIWLSSAVPARAVPDVLVGTTSLIVGGILGILVPSKRAD